MTETPETMQAWLLSLIPCPTVEATIERAAEEWQEMLDATTPEERLKEIADVGIVLVTNPIVWQAMVAKMAVNRQRRWHVTPEGHVYHVKEAQ